MPPGRHGLGQLFIGLSFFIVISALLLTGLLFVFGVEQRAQEMGLLLAIGFTIGRVRRLLLGEGLIVAVVGAALGVAGGMMYNEAVLRGLSTVWSGAVGLSDLQAHVTPLTLVTGFLSGVLVALLAMVVMVRQQSLKSVAQLQKGGDATALRRGRSRPLWSMLVMVACLAGVLLIVAMSPSAQAAETFFSLRRAAPCRRSGLLECGPDLDGMVG